jgi:predicted phosphodiesterase
MKIALIADVHGNIFALDAVLDDAVKSGADTYVFVGDYIFDMPFSNEVTERIRNLQTVSSVHIIAGNKEARLTGYINADKTAWIYEQMGAVYQAFRELKTGNLDWLKSLPESLTIKLPGNRKLLALHTFTPLFPDGIGIDRTRNAFNSSGYFMREHKKNRFSHDEYLKQIAGVLTGNSYADRFSEYDAEIIVSGHTHLQWYAFSGDKLLINPGGCGQPLDGNPRAPYTLLTVTKEDVQIDERRVSYDVDAAISAARKTEIYKHGHIFLESCFLSMRSGYAYMSELRETARRIAAEHGASTPVKEPVDNDIWRLAGKEFYKTM